MSANEPLPLRQYQAGDESQILPLFKEVFEEHKSVEHWQWQFRSHPKGPGWIAVADLNGEIVGHHGVMRSQLNCNGREVSAGHEVDAMIKERARGGGIYTRLGVFSHAQAAQDGARALYAFPSRNSSPGSYPLIVRRLGYRRITNLQQFTRRVGFRSYVGPLDGVVRALAGLLDGVRSGIRFARGYAGLTVDVTSTIPDDCDTALKQILDYEVMAIWKDKAYLKWRYEGSPIKYVVYTLRRDGETHGLVVARIKDATLSICEVLHRRKNIRETAFLLTKLVQHARRSAVQHIEFNGFDNGFFEAAFRNAGFHFEPFAKYIFVAKVMNDPDLEPIFYQPLNWSISWGDGDEL